MALLRYNHYDYPSIFSDRFFPTCKYFTYTYAQNFKISTKRIEKKKADLCDYHKIGGGLVASHV